EKSRSPGRQRDRLIPGLSALTGKWLELLRGVLPALRRIALLWDSTTGSAQLNAMKNRLPAISPFRIFADFGGLMSYGPDLEGFFRRCSTYVDKILKGASPGDLPFEQPLKFQLVVNLRTSKALGITIPQSLLLRADEVIATP